MQLPKIRRVVTGDDESGKAIVKIDEACSHERRPGAFVCNVLMTDTTPADNSGHADMRTSDSARAS